MTSRFTPLHFFKLTLFLFLAIGGQFSAAAYQQNLPFNIAINNGIEVDPSIKKARQLTTRFVSVIFKLIDANQKHISVMGLPENILSATQKYLYKNQDTIPYYVKKALREYDFLAKNSEKDCRLSGSLKLLVEQINDVVAPLGFREFFIAEELYDDSAVTLGLIENSIIKLENFYKTYKNNPTWKDKIANYLNRSFLSSAMLPTIVKFIVMAVIFCMMWYYQKSVKLSYYDTGFKAYIELIKNKGKGTVKEIRGVCIDYSVLENYPPTMTENEKAQNREMKLSFARTRYEELTTEMLSETSTNALLGNMLAGGSIGVVGFQIGTLVSDIVAAAQKNKILARLANESRMRNLSDILNNSRQIGNGVEFDHIVGYEDVKQLFRVVLDNLSNPLKYYYHHGIETPRGIFMYGPAGVGKTMFMKALASEAKRLSISCIAVNANQLVSCAQYTSEEIIRALYALADELAPCIIFIDEIDGIISHKDSEYRSEVETNLLAAWDGIQKNKNANPAAPVITIVTSNNPDRFRIEFVRAGRMDIKIPFMYPDKAMREELLRRAFFDKDSSSASTPSSKNLFGTKEVSRPVIKQEDVVTPSNLAERIEGYSDAQIKALINLARLIAEYEGASNIFDDPKYLSIAKKFIGVPEAAKTPEL